MEATIQKWGNSLALRIPKSVAQEIRITEGDSVELKVDTKGLLVRPRHRRYRLSDLVRKITDRNRHQEIDCGPSAGKEIW